MINCESLSVQESCFKEEVVKTYLIPNRNGLNIM